MTLNSSLVGLMDAARIKYPIVNKLTIDDLTKLLRSKVVSDKTIKMAGAVDDDSWQKIQIDYNSSQFQIYPYGDLGYVSANKGDTIFQGITLKTDGKFDSTCISFYQKGVGHQNVVADIKDLGDNTFRVSAIYTCSSDGNYLLQDLNNLIIYSGTYVEIKDCYATISSSLGGQN